MNSWIWQTCVNAYCYCRYPRLVWFAAKWRDGWLPSPALPVNSIDKFLWRKIFDRDPETVAMSDKLLAKDIAVQRVPEIKVPGTLWVGTQFEDIPEDILAGDVVVKATHGSGLFHVIHGGQYDRDELISMTRKWLVTDYHRYHGEWNYRGIERRLFVEEMLKDKHDQPVRVESKIYVFGEVPLYSFHFHDRLSKHKKMSLYDRSGKAQAFIDIMNIEPCWDDAPASHQKMFDTAARLSGGRDHVRVDLYEVDGDVYFSEYTFYNLGGFLSADVRAAYPETEVLWDLRRSWFLRTPQTGWRKAYAKWLNRRLQQCSGDTGERP
ncbi:MAG: ATP-grasp fold amidoligase family protein [Anderseniella sp.]